MTSESVDSSVDLARRGGKEAVRSMFGALQFTPRLLTFCPCLSCRKCLSFHFAGFVRLRRFFLSASRVLLWRRFWRLRLAPRLSRLSLLSFGVETCLQALHFTRMQNHAFCFLRLFCLVFTASPEHLPSLCAATHPTLPSPCLRNR